MKQFLKREDATNTLINATELESLRNDLYVKYPEALYSRMIPVDSGDDEGAESVGYLQFDSIGASAIIASGTADSPSVDAVCTKVLLPVHELGNHFKYDYREIRNMRMAGRKLDVIKPRIAAQAIEQQHDDIAILGDGTKDKWFGGMYGVVFHPNATKISAPKTFASSTPEEIIKEFAKMDAKIAKDTKGMFAGNTFAMSQDLVAELEGILVTGTSVSVMERLRSTYADRYTFITHPKLEDVKKNPTTSAVTATRVILCYNRSSDVLNYKQPMPFKMYPAVPEGRSSRTETASTTAGVELRQPLAVVVYHSF